MSQKHIKKVQKIFEHPVVKDLDIHRVIAALEHFGCEVEHAKNGKVKVFYNGNEVVLNPHPGSLTKEEIIKLRHFMEQEGLTPEKLAA